MTGPVAVLPTLHSDEAVAGGTSTMLQFAEGLVSGATSYANALAQLGAGLVGPPITPTFPSGGGAPNIPVGAAFNPPDLQSWEAGGEPGNFDASLSLDVAFPTFGGIAPSLDFGTVPTPQFPRPGERPPTSVLPEIPDVSVSLPTAPALLSLQIGSFGGVTLPEVPDDAIPTMSLVAPTATTYIPGTQYASELLTALTTSLQSRITAGGTGLAPAIEQAIFDRAREREIRTLNDAILDLDRMESMGYAFPPGVFLDARLKARTEFGKVEAGLSRDIAIKQAELELSNVQEALKIATQLEAQFAEIYDRMNQRIFDTAKYTTEAAISIYNAQVQAYSTTLEAYKTRIAIFESRVRAELSKVEVYRAQIAGEQAKAEVNNALVNQYKVQVDAALSGVEVYKARISGIQARAEIEKIKVAIYAEEIRAFTAHVGAYVAEVEGYKAQAQAQASKQEAYRHEVEAYEAQVQAVAKQADTRIEEFKARTTAYVAAWEGFRAKASASAARAGAEAANVTALANVHTAQAQTETAIVELATKQWQVALDQGYRVTEIGLAAAKANSDAFMALKSIMMDGSKTAAQVFAQMGASALNALNFSTSYASSNSANWSTSVNNNNNTNVNL